MNGENTEATNLDSENDSDIDDSWPTSEMIMSRNKLVSILKQMYAYPLILRSYQTVVQSSESYDEWYFDEIKSSLKYLSIVSSGGYIERILNHAVTQDSLRYSKGLYRLYVEKDVKSGANPNIDRIKSIVKAINPDGYGDVNNFLDSSHQFNPDFESPARRHIAGRESLKNRQLLTDYLLKFRNHVAHSRKLHEYDSVSVDYENIIDMVEFSLNFGVLLESILDPSLRWQKVRNGYRLI